MQTRLASILPGLHVTLAANLNTSSRSRLASAITRWAAATAIALTALSSVPQADAAYTLTLLESGGNVVGTGSGTINTAGLSPSNPATMQGLLWPDSGFGGYAVTGSPNAQDEFYTQINGPSTFGTATRTPADSGTGDTVGVIGNNGLFLPSTYVSSSQLTSSSTWTGKTFASLGLTPGTYVWTWGDGATADSFTLQIGAPPIVVNTTADTHADGFTTLREAITQAETQDGADTIVFDPTVFATAQTITLNGSGLPVITQDLTITGPGASLLTVDGTNSNYQNVFEVDSGSTTISGLTVSNAYYGIAPSDGGTATVDRCQLANNQYAFYNAGTLIATNCTISGGDNSYYGLDNEGGSASLTNCTIGDLGNGGGYAIQSYYPVTLTNCTLVGSYYGIYQGSDTATISNTLFANASGQNISHGRRATITSLGYNLSSDDASDVLTDRTDQNQEDPKLDPNGLQDNGGPTLTIALQSGSPAIDKGDPNSTLTTDQRGFARPVDGNADSTKTIDIGAFEYGALPPGTFLVNSTADTVADDGVTTLREAIAAAEADPGANKIIFDPTVFATPQTIKLTNGQLVLTSDLTITGPAAGVTVSGNKASRVFYVATGVTASISGLTIRDGNGVGALPDRHSGSGGGIWNDGKLTLTNCTITGNTGLDYGGGIEMYDRTGSLTILGCTISNNTGGEGGGISHDNGTLVVTNSTISGNQATQNGYNAGGIYSSGASATITNCTITGNTGTGVNSGGGLRDDAAASFTVSNSIVAGNSGTNGATADVNGVNGGAFTSGGYNLIGDGTGATGFTNGTKGDRVGTTAAKIDPKLNALANNGGPTMTMSLKSDSPAIDAGDPNSTLTTDQRGYGRPIDGPDANTTKTVDIGAFEFGAFPPGTYVVDNATDTHADGFTTLREAMTAAGADGLDSAIIFDPTVFATAKTITLGGTELPVIKTNMTITGPAAGLTVDANHTSRIFEVAGATVGISGLTITNGYANSSNGYYGGGVFQSGGSLTLTNCSITNSKTDFAGGGIGQENGALIMNGCTVSGNSNGGGYVGGGGYISGTLTATNCTFANNIGSAGGALNAGEGSTFTNCTISGNQATAGGYGGGGLRGGGFTLNNCIVAGNTAPNSGAGPDIQGYSDILGDYNLIQDTNGWSFASGQGTHNITGQDPLLNPLANNGGLTQTMALQTSPVLSPAIDKGDPNSTLTSDQRGEPRPEDGPDVDTTAIIDIGAFEVQGPKVKNDIAFTVDTRAILIDVLANDPPGGGAIAIVTQPAHGTAVVVGGKIKYTPKGSFPMEGDSFTYSYAGATATVTVKHFGTYAGYYDGLVEGGASSNSVRSVALPHERFGYLQVTLNRLGDVSFVFTLGGVNYPLAGGTLDAAGHAVRQVKRTAPLAPIDVVLQLDADTGMLTGTVSSSDFNQNAFTSTIAAQPRVKPESRAGSYTLLVAPTVQTTLTTKVAALAEPQGTGYAKVTIDAAGNVVTTGKLADDTTFSCSTYLHEDGSFAIYDSLYGGTYLQVGSVRGVLTFSNVKGPAGDASGDCTWFKPRRTADKVFPNGFTLTRDGLLARYTKPATNQRILAFDPVQKNGTASIGLGGFPSFAQDFTLAPNQVVTPATPNPNSLTLSFDVVTGLFHGTFINPANKKSTPFYGAIFQADASGAGYFLGAGTNDAGEVEIEKKPTH